MKKIIAIVLVCIIASTLICVGVSATAENTTKNIAKEQITSEELSKMTTEEIAYLNLENADEEAKETILAARNKIIYTREWAADGYSGYVTDKDGNIKRVLPKFSEVFPGWEFPKLERKSNPTVQPKFINCDIDDINAAIESKHNADDTNKAQSKITEQMTTEEIAHLDIDTADKETKDAILAARNEIIFSQEWVADGYSMEVVDAEGNVKRTIPKFSELFPGWDLPKATRNKAPTTLPTTVESRIGFLENLSIDDGAVIHNVGDMYLGVRASTYSTPGWAYFDLLGAYRYGYIK